MYNEKEENSQFESSVIRELTIEKQRMKQLEHGFRRLAKEIDKKILENKW